MSLMRNLLNRVLHKVAMIAPGGNRVRPLLHRLRGVHLGTHVWISQYVYLDELHPEVITIGSHSSIGLRTSVITHLYWGRRRSSEHAGPVCIGEHVFIGPHCVILPNVRIGDGAVIPAGTVVSKNVPAQTVWRAAAAGPVAHASVPLADDTSYDLFRKGLRPFGAESGTSSDPT